MISEENQPGHLQILDIAVASREKIAIGQDYAAYLRQSRLIQILEVPYIGGLGIWWRPIKAESYSSATDALGQWLGRGIFINQWLGKGIYVKQWLVGVDVQRVNFNFS